MNREGIQYNWAKRAGHVDIAFSGVSLTFATGSPLHLVIFITMLGAFTKSQSFVKKVPIPKEQLISFLYLRYNLIAFLKFNPSEKTIVLLNGSIPFIS